MTLFIFVISIILGVLVAASFFISYSNRKVIPAMTGMMGAMIIGMGVGLTTGVLFGVLYQNDLMLATILSMFIGMTTGIFAGLPKGPLAILDGLLAGLMGGMMGAMLGVMVSGAEGILLVKVLLLITACSTFIILILLHSNSSKERPVTTSWMLKPVLTFCLFLLVFIGVGLIDVSNDDKGMVLGGDSGHNEQSQNDEEDGHRAGKQTNHIVKVVIPGLSYNPEILEIDKAQSVELQLINHDNVEHDLEVRYFPFKLLKEPEHVNAEHHNPGLDNNSLLHLHAQPQSTASISLFL